MPGPGPGMTAEGGKGVKRPSAVAGLVPITTSSCVGVEKARFTLFQFRDFVMRRAAEP